MATQKKMSELFQNNDGQYEPSKRYSQSVSELNNQYDYELTQATNEKKGYWEEVRERIRVNAARRRVEAQTRLADSQRVTALEIKNVQREGIRIGVLSDGRTRGGVWGRC